MSSTRTGLEAALVANPDDAATHAAYADLLMEEGDPRGEYIQLQLALEDRNQPVERLDAMEERRRQLQKQYEREWLGPLALHVYPKRAVRSVGDMVADDNVEITWRRGWIDAILIWRLNDQLAAAIADCPLTRLLTVLCVRHNYDWHEVSLYPLFKAGRLGKLRTFELGSANGHLMARGFEVDEYFSHFGPCLEVFRIAVDQVNPTELFGGNFPALNTIAILSNNAPLPLAELATNPRLAELKTLLLDRTSVEGLLERLETGRESYTMEMFEQLFRSSYLPKLDSLGLRLPDFGDRGVELLIESGFINRLKVLDLCRCSITDEGAELLARCPHVANLDHLHLDNNLLSPVGIEALAEVGVAVSERQFYAGGWGANGEIAT